MYENRATRILAICGSLRRDSYNAKLMRAAARSTPAGLELAEWSELRAIPPFSEDDETTPAPEVIALRDAIAAADAVLVVTPEYNASLPGQLKNALDWASRPFPNNALRDKPVAVIGASPSPGGAARAQADARKVLGAIGARVLDGELRVARAYAQFDSDSALITAEHQMALDEILAALAAEAGDRTIALEDRLLGV